MILLIDFDSILYTSVYRIVSIGEIRDALSKFGKPGARQWMNEEVYNEGINRCENTLLKIQNHLDSIMISDVSSVELFITTCKNSFRKKLSSEYKIKRKRNKYVWMLRDHYQLNGAHCSDTHEADDLIANRAKELGVDNCVVVSMDKDLKQIGGYYWSYYTQKMKDSQGEFIMNEHGNHEKGYKQRSIDYITKKEAELYLWESVLSGDPGDNIKGITPISKEEKEEIEKEYGVKIACRVGAATAKKILSESQNHFITTARQYILRGQKQDFWTNYKLLKLGNYQS